MRQEERIEEKAGDFREELRKGKGELWRIRRGEADDRVGTEDGIVESEGCAQGVGRNYVNG